MLLDLLRVDGGNNPLPLSVLERVGDCGPLLVVLFRIDRGDFGSPVLLVLSRVRPGSGDCGGMLPELSILLMLPAGVARSEFGDCGGMLSELSILLSGMPPELSILLMREGAGELGALLLASLILLLSSSAGASCLAEMSSFARSDNCNALPKPPLLRRFGERGLAVVAERGRLIECVPSSWGLSATSKETPWPTNSIAMLLFKGWSVIFRSLNNPIASSTDIEG